MLRLITLCSSNTAAAHSQFVQSLNGCAKAAGFEVYVPDQGLQVPDADGFIVLASSADSFDALNSRLKVLANDYKNRVVALITVGEASTAEDASRVVLLPGVPCFIYPHVWAVNVAKPASGEMESWLAGFSKFVAAIKMWRSLDGVSLETAALEAQRPRLAHLNILTRDLEASQAFYTRIFGACYCYNLGPRKVVMELNGFDFFIELSTDFVYPEGYHIGIRALPEDVQRIADLVAADGSIKLVKGNGPQPGFHYGPDNVRTAVYFEDPDGLVVEVYSSEIEMIESNPRLLLDQL